MAAPDQVAARAGQVNAAGSDRALFLKVFAGETMEAFEEKNVMKSRTMLRTIEHGTSAQFPATGKAVASYHTPGAYILGQSIKANERLITIDDMLIAPVFIANIDEAMSHYDFRRPFSKQCGYALANKMDTNLLQLAVLAARASATVTGGNGGTQLTNATFGTNADDLVDGAFAAAQAFDEKDVPESGRYFGVKPAQYYLLVNSSSKAIHRDYTGGANGGVDSGMIMRIAGLEVVKTNHLPSTNVNSGPTAYQGDFTNTVAVAWQQGAVGTAELVGLAVEMDYLIENQGTLIVAKYVLGHGILRPECAVELKSA